MSGNTQILVHSFRDKLRALIGYSKKRPSLGCPTTNKDIAARLNDLLDRQIRPESLSKAGTTEGEVRLLTAHEHELLLSIFNIQWPCLTYFDPEGLTQANGAADFEAWLERKDACVRMVDKTSRISNLPAFADKDLFVFDIEDFSDGQMYQGRLIAKPARKMLIGEEGEFAGVRVGYYGLSEITIRLTYTSDVSCTAKKTEHDARASFIIRDRSANDDCAWLVRSRSDDEATIIHYLDEEIDVASLQVTDLGKDGELTIEASAHLPSIELRIPRDVIDKSKQDEQSLKVKLQKVAQAVVVDRYVTTPSSPDDHSQMIVLGSVRLGSKY